MVIILLPINEMMLEFKIYMVFVFFSLSTVYNKPRKLYTVHLIKTKA